MRYYESEEARRKIDALLVKNAAIQANLGKESTNEDRENAKEEWKSILSEIRRIDPEFAARCNKD